LWFSLGRMDGYIWKSTLSWKNTFEKQKNNFYGSDSIMITLNDLKTCENCGNIFAKKILSKTISRCPACNVWKKQASEGKNEV